MFSRGKYCRERGEGAEGYVAVKVGSAGFEMDAEERPKDESDADPNASPREEAGLREAARDGDARTREERSVEARRIHERERSKKELNRNSTCKVPN